MTAGVVVKTPWSLKRGSVGAEPELVMKTLVASAWPVDEFRRLVDARVGEADRQHERAQVRAIGRRRSDRLLVAHLERLGAAEEDVVDAAVARVRADRHHALADLGELVDGARLAALGLEGAPHLVRPWRSFCKVEP
jgi:hypothetical protein